jgi:hypothetical protein
MDAKAIAANGLKSACKLILQDLQALPEEAYDKTFSAKTRTVADIIYEVNLVNDHIGMVIRGEQPFDWPEEAWIKAPPEFRSKEVVVESFERSSERIVATVEGFSPEQIEETIKTDEGETTRFERCRFMTLHMWYHSGQLNFIQTLLGDDAWHWK